jgi:broad specificity phosphatase PhoE
MLNQGPFPTCTTCTLLWSQTEEPKRKRIGGCLAESTNCGESHSDGTVSSELPIIYLARHGETAWSLSGQHTGLTDLPLTSAGELTAKRLTERLSGLTFSKVFTSPLQRAMRTSALAGFGAVAEVDPDLVEWDYGHFEGLTGEQIRTHHPQWQLFRDGCPGGESPQQVAARADRVITRIRAVEGDVLLFSSGHFIRILATRWIGVEPTVNARSFMLSTASLSALGYERDFSRPVIRLWNDTHHVTQSSGSMEGMSRAALETSAKR